MKHKISFRKALIVGVGGAFILKILEVYSHAVQTGALHVNTAVIQLIGTVLLSLFILAAVYAIKEKLIFIVPAIWFVLHDIYNAIAIQEPTLLFLTVIETALIALPLGFAIYYLTVIRNKKGCD